MTFFNTAEKKFYQPSQERALIWLRFIPGLFVKDVFQMLHSEHARIGLTWGYKDKGNSCGVREKLGAQTLQSGSGVSRLWWCPELWPWTDHFSIWYVHYHTLPPSASPSQQVSCKEGSERMCCASRKQKGEGSFMTSGLWPLTSSCHRLRCWTWALQRMRKCQVQSVRCALWIALPPRRPHHLLGVLTPSPCSRWLYLDRASLQR